VKDQLARIPGVGDVTVFGARDYSMRIWLDPEKLARAQHGRPVMSSARSANRIFRWPPARLASRPFRQETIFNHHQHAGAVAG